MKNEQGCLYEIRISWERVGAMTGRISARWNGRAQLVLRDLERFSNGERPDLHLPERSRTVSTVLVRIVRPL